MSNLNALFLLERKKLVIRSEVRHNASVMFVMAFSNSFESSSPSWQQTKIMETVKENVYMRFRRSLHNKVKKIANN